MSDTTDEYASWISDFCALYGRDYLVEVASEFIEDDFNLTGLSSMVPFYREALDMILDFEPDQPVKVSDMPLIQHSAELLYGLIHQRYIITKQGLAAMREKYEKKQFGVCPRYYCDGMPLLPVGRQDLPGFEAVRLFCPSCLDLYLPNSSRYLSIDGAFFGTTFPGLFMKMFPEIEKKCKLRAGNLSSAQYDLKVFGFRLNEQSAAGSRMKWLRQVPQTNEEMIEYNDCEYRMINDEEMAPVG